MNKVEKIKAEIEKRKDEFMTQANSFESLGMTEKVTYFSALASNMAALVRYIDSLEEEPVSNDLEEAAKNYEEDAIFYAARKISDFFKAGAEWQKEKMMEDAVEGEIYFNMDYLQYHINTEPLTHFHHGDKVKLIIVKEE